MNDFCFGASVQAVGSGIGSGLFFNTLFGIQVGLLNMSDSVSPKCFPNKPNNVMYVCGTAGCPLAPRCCEDSHKSEGRLQTSEASL